MSEIAGKLGATYQLRAAANEDRAAIEALVFGVLAEYGLRPDPAGTDADLKDLHASYHAAGGVFEVLTDAAGKVVGTVALHRVSASTCELRKMYVARAVRGQGLGWQLLEHAIARAAALGFSRMELETASVLREAVALYERFGFRRFEPAHLAPRCDAAYFLELPAPRESARRLWRSPHERAHSANGLGRGSSSASPAPD